MKASTGSKNRFFKGAAVVLAVLAISLSCTKTMDNTYGSGSGNGGGGNNTGPGTNAVWIQGMAFDPNTITVTAGTTVTWTNKDMVNHTVTSTSGVFDSGTLGNNATFSYMFATAGTYGYKCNIHPSMTGTVVVK